MNVFSLLHYRRSLAPWASISGENIRRYPAVQELYLLRGQELIFRAHELVFRRHDFLFFIFLTRHVWSSGRYCAYFCSLTRCCHPVDKRPHDLATAKKESVLTVTLCVCNPSPHKTHYNEHLTKMIILKI